MVIHDSVSKEQMLCFYYYPSLQQYFLEIKLKIMETNRQKQIQEEHQAEEDYHWQEQFLQMEADLQRDIFYEVSPQQMSHPLHKNIAIIVGRAKDLEVKGSGILISPNLVLTCAHNVFYIEKSTQGQIIKTLLKPSQIQVYPGHYGSLFKGQDVGCIYIAPEYLTGQKKQLYDYALIKLKRKVDSFEFIRLNCDLKIQTDQKIGIFGYPKSSYTYNKSNKMVVRQRGLIKSNALFQLQPQQGKILHKVCTEKGQSGCPIFLIQGKDISIIGIHTGTNYSLNMNLGRLITYKLVSKLMQEARKMGAQMFITEGKPLAYFWLDIAKEHEDKQQIPNSSRQCRYNELINDY